MTNLDWRTTLVDRSAPLRRQLAQHGLVLGVLVIALWMIELVDAIIFHGALAQLGIRPRTPGGLAGIAVAPWLHSGFGHLFANTAPLIVLGWLVLMRRTADFFVVLLAATVASGVGIWLFGGANTVHVGISGVIFGLFGYLLGRSVFERSVAAVALGVVAFLLFGGMLWSTLPLQTGISWQGHLFGFLGGLAVAYFQVRRWPRLALQLKS